MRSRVLATNVSVVSSADNFCTIITMRLKHTSRGGKGVYFLSARNSKGMYMDWSRIRRSEIDSAEATRERGLFFVPLSFYPDRGIA
jgi:hypothetical protein